MLSELTTSIMWFQISAALYEICDLLRYYAGYRGNSVPTFHDNLSDPSSRAKRSSWPPSPLKIQLFLCTSQKHTAERRLGSTRSCFRH
jgi:hypothetical protein